MAVDAQQQCSESASIPSRVRVTANDELLLLSAFEFEPIARSLGDVHAVPIFRDDTLLSPLARLSVIGLTFTLAALRYRKEALRKAFDFQGTFRLTENRETQGEANY